MVFSNLSKTALVYTLATRNSNPQFPSVFGLVCSAIQEGFQCHSNLVTTSIINITMTTYRVMVSSRCLNHHLMVQVLCHLLCKFVHRCWWTNMCTFYNKIHTLPMLGGNHYSTIQWLHVGWNPLRSRLIQRLQCWVSTKFKLPQHPLPCLIKLSDSQWMVYHWLEHLLEVPLLKSCIQLVELWHEFYQHMPSAQPVDRCWKHLFYSIGHYWALVCWCTFINTIYMLGKVYMVHRRYISSHTLWKILWNKNADLLGSPSAPSHPCTSWR